MPNITVALNIGLKIGDTTYKDLTFRSATLGDLMDAEEDATVTSPISFRAALLARTLVSVGAYDGPVTLKMLRSLDPADWQKVSDAMRGDETAGEADSASESAS